MHCAAEHHSRYDPCMSDSNSQATSANSKPLQPLPVDQLRWQCDPAAFKFETTDEVNPIVGIIGQDAAIEALEFGLESGAAGQNIYVRGLTGTGRMTLVRRLLDDIRPQCKVSPDRVYTHNFDDPIKPKLLTLKRGRATAFARQMDQLADFIRDDLAEALSSEGVNARLSALQEASRERVQKAARPLEEALKETGLALVMVTGGPVPRPALFAKVDGEPVAPEVWEMKHQQGEISDEDYADVEAHRAKFQPKVDELANEILAIMQDHHKGTRKLLEEETRSQLKPMVNDITREFDDDGIAEFIDQILNDLIANRMEELPQGGDFVERYRVNPILAHDDGIDCPSVIENSPTLANLIGGIDSRFVGDEMQPPDHMSIRGGSILQADGGFLVLDARDVLSEPGAWKALVRTLRTQMLEIANAQQMFLIRTTPLKPEPIEVSVKVVLIGDPGLYYLLDHADPDFPQLFKVLAEFDTVIPRNEKALEQYAAVIARIQEDDDLLPFDASAVAALAEHGARIASRRDKISTRFSRLADIAREASFLARKADRATVTGDDVRETVRRTKRRANLASRKFREYLVDGTIKVQTSGKAIGQINGLAVVTAGPLTYGFPARITTSVGPGSSGVINIERESSLSGAIHTKGFFILSGLLRNLLRADHPLAFDASIAFEQSYGGIDGDSASGAEICCLMSALCRIPIRQDLAMTGAIDQVGNILAIGGVNEKIEGFFDVCNDLGLTGTQGVLIPQSNAGDLMLRHDVVEACEQGKFAVYAVDNVLDAMTLLMDRDAGQPTDAEIRVDTIIASARQRAEHFWRLMAKSRSGNAQEPEAFSTVASRERLDGRD